MITISQIENLGPKDIVDIRAEDGEIVFTARSSTGNYKSIHYSEIERELESCRIYETRLNLARYELNGINTWDDEVIIQEYGTNEIARGRKVELQLEIALCEVEVRKNNRVSHLFYQLVVTFKAGLIKNGSDYIKLTGENLATGPNSAVTENTSTNPTDSNEFGKTHQHARTVVIGNEEAAMDWAVDEFIRTHKPKKNSHIPKSRPLAVAATDKFFPGLKGQERKRKIDSFRGRIPAAVKKKLKQPP